MEMTSIAVYCGSMKGERPIYAEKAVELGLLMAKNDLKLIYGGGNVGLMGVIANAVLDGGGIAIGVCPAFLMQREVVHRDLHEMHVVQTMSERRDLMIELADGFIAMPGGYGTLDEISEVLMYTILGTRKYPVGLLNIEGFYDPLKMQLDRMVDDGFLQAPYRDAAIFAENTEELLEKMKAYTPPQYDKFASGDIYNK